MEGAQQRCDMGRLNISRAAAFCMSCRGLIAHTGRLARSHCSSLEDSRLVSIPQSGKCFAGGICTIWLLLVWRLQLTAHCPVWHKGSWFSVWVRWLSCLLKWQGFGMSVSWLEEQQLGFWSFQLQMMAVHPGRDDCQAYSGLWGYLVFRGYVKRGSIGHCLNDIASLTEAMIPGDHMVIDLVYRENTDLCSVGLLMRWSEVLSWYLIMGPVNWSWETFVVQICWVYIQCIRSNFTNSILKCASKSLHDCIICLEKKIKYFIFICLRNIPGWI